MENITKYKKVRGDTVIILCPKCQCISSEFLNPIDCFHCESRLPKNCRKKLLTRNRQVIEVTNWITDGDTLYKPGFAPRSKCTSDQDCVCCNCSKKEDVPSNKKWVEERASSEQQSSNSENSQSSENSESLSSFSASNVDKDDMIEMMMKMSPYKDDPLESSLPEHCDKLLPKMKTHSGFKEEGSNDDMCVHKDVSAGISSRINDGITQPDTLCNTKELPTENSTSTVLIYPDRQGIRVTKDDIACLDNNNWLNDTIIDFYLQYIYHEKIPPEIQAKTHIFSSFFYKGLEFAFVDQFKGKKVPKAEIESMKNKWTMERKWTKNVNIFTKDFIFIPINPGGHWYLAAICNITKLFEPPGKNESHQKLQAKERMQQEKAGRHERVGTPKKHYDLRSVTEEKKLHTPPEKESVQKLQAKEGMQQEKQRRHERVRTPKKRYDLRSVAEEKKLHTPPEATKHEDDDGNDEISNKIVTDKESHSRYRDIKISGSSHSETDDDEVKVVSDFLSVKKKKESFELLKFDLTDDCTRITRKQKNENPHGKKEPCICFFDSMDVRRYVGLKEKRVAKTLKEFLEKLWTLQNPNVPCDWEKLLFLKACCPQQGDLSNCGIYLLQYVESFFEKPIAYFQDPLPDLRKWFSADTVKNKRPEIKNVISKLKEDHLYVIDSSEESSSSVDLVLDL